MPFRITTKNVLEFTWRRRTVDSAKEKLKGKFLKNIEHDLFTRGQMAAYMNSDRWLNQGAKKLIFTACYSCKLKLAFTSPDIISTSPKHFLTSRIDVTFLKGRKSLSATEELETRRIAKARIHVERFNERLKQFKLVSRRIPLSLAPVATQMVVVAVCLVNFQAVLCN